MHSMNILFLCSAYAVSVICLVFPYLAHTLVVLDAIEAILAEEGFLISSPSTVSARKCAEKFTPGLRTVPMTQNFKCFVMATILKICYYGHHEYICERLHI